MLVYLYRLHKHNNYYYTYFIYYLIQPPSVSLRPAVIDYHVYHNITSSDGSLVHNVTNNMTYIVFTSVSRGNQYIANVTAENIVGIGEESLINGKFASFMIKIKFNNYIISI